jgi:hypothetical protein
LTAPAGHTNPDEWAADVSEAGTLFATFYDRRTAPLTVADRHGADTTLEPVVNGEAWPHGLAVSWDSVDGSPTAAAASWTGWLATGSMTRLPSSAVK